MRSVFLVPIVLWLATVGGCGSKYSVVPVSGTITFNDKPLVNATILTQPVSQTAENDAPGPGSFGKTDAEGRFALELQNEPTPGAVPGKCVIMITEKGHSDNPASDEISREDYRSRLPDQYRNGKFTYTIPEDGTDAMDIIIETGKRR